MTFVFFSKNVAPISPFPRREENKKCYGSMRLLSIFQNVLQIMIGYSGSTKNVGDDRGVTAQLSLPFSGGKWVVWKKVKTSNISDTMPPIFFIL